MIDASGESQAFFFEQPYYVVVHDLVVRNAANNGINADDGSAFDDPEAARHGPGQLRLPEQPLVRARRAGALRTVAAGADERRRGRP